MLQLLTDLPDTVVGVRATASVVEADYVNVLLPALEDLNKRRGKLNVLMLLETNVGNYTIGAWLRDFEIGFKYFTHWHRVAIVSDQNFVRTFTNTITFFAPGEYKGFPLADLPKAKVWVAS